MNQPVQSPAMPSVLNVGGGSRDIPIPPRYDGWQHVLLDIDPWPGVDVVADARELLALPSATYDAVYCAHNLEHYHYHEAGKVARGFHHVLREDGFAEIIVPDVLKVMRHVAAGGMDLDDALYQSQVGPIRVRDVLWGYQAEIERSGNEFFAHKGGFSPKSLRDLLTRSGFEAVFTTEAPTFAVLAFAFKRPVSRERFEQIVTGKVP